MARKTSFHPWMHPRDRLLSLGIALVATGAVLDVVSTFLIFSQGWQDTNPVVEGLIRSHGWEVYILAKLAVAAGFLSIGVVSRRAPRAFYKRRLVSTAAMVTAGTLWLAGAGWNLLLYTVTAL